MKKIKVTQKFEWDPSGLGAYVKQNIDDIVERLVEGAKSAKLMRTMQGIKGTQELNDFDLSFNWQDGSNCGNEPDGTASFGKKNITVADIEVKLTFCNKDLPGFLTEQKLAPGASGELEQLPFEAMIVNQLLLQNDLKVDRAIWKSDTNSADPNLNKFIGLIRQADADSNITDLTVSGNQITSTNAIAAFGPAGFDAQLPSELTSNPNFAYVTDRSTFMDLLQNMYSDLKDSPQYFIRDMQDTANGEIIAVRHPITNAMIWWVPGLANTGMVFAGLFGAQGQYILGTDRDGDFTDVKVKYDEFEETWEVKLRFRLGVTYRLSENVGFFEPSAS